MNKLYKKIEQDINCLPKRDKELCVKFLQSREIDKVLEISESCLIMKKKDDHKTNHNEKWVNVDRDKLEKLVLNIREYMSYLDYDNYNIDNNFYE